MPTRKNFRDLTGQTFGRLTVIGFAGMRPFSTQSHACWRCRCACGREKVVMACNLLGGRSASCGVCVHSERLTTHGQSRTATYRSWLSIKGGSAGFCPEWESFETFLADMGEKPPGCGLTRINCRLPHGPGNSVWSKMWSAPASKYLTNNGTTLHQSAWARRLGISRQALGQRILAGWIIERALTEGRAIP